MTSESMSPKEGGNLGPTSGGQEEFPVWDSEVGEGKWWAFCVTCEMDLYHLHNFWGVCGMGCFSWHDLGLS